MPLLPLLLLSLPPHAAATEPACPCAAALCRPLVNAPRPAKEVFLVAQAVKPLGGPKPPIDWRSWDGLRTATTIVYAWGHPLRWHGNGSAYVFNEYGETDPFPDRGLLCAAHARGVRVILSVPGGAPYGNATALLPHPSRYPLLATNLARLIKQFGFDGMEADFEGQYKSKDTAVWSQYLGFLRTLQATLHREIPGSYLTMTHECGPMPFMAKHARDCVAATDAVLLMCYDFNTRCAWRLSLAPPADPSLSDRGCC